MKRAIVCAIWLCACSKTKPHAAATAGVPAAQAIGVMKAFADQACACGTDMSCLHAVRDQYDPQKPLLVANPSFTAADQAALAEQGTRLAMCGDAGGVTFW